MQKTEARTVIFTSCAREVTRLVSTRPRLLQAYVHSEQDSMWHIVRKAGYLLPPQKATSESSV